MLRYLLFVGLFLTSVAGLAEAGRVAPPRRLNMGDDKDDGAANGCVNDARALV